MAGKAVFAGFWDMTAEDSSPRSFAFGEFILDLQRGALLKDGVDVPLRPKSFQVLLYLVEHHGQLVSKDELLSEIWADTVVTDGAVTQCLIDIRRAIDDSKHEKIRTVPRRGFIFEHAVVGADGKGHSSSPTGKHWNHKTSPLLALGALAAAFFLWQLLSQDSDHRRGLISNSIAVMPFADMSATQDQQYLGDGLSEDLLNALAQNSDLRVIARTSSFSIADRSRDIAAIRDVLDVAFVLEGSVRRQGDLIRVTAQLIETASSTHVWSQSFDSGIPDLRALTQFIARRVQQEILPGSEPVDGPPELRNVSSNELMLLGRYYENQVREQPEVDDTMLQKAIDLYREVTLAEPDSAEAHSRLAGALLYAGDVNAAEPAVFRALSLNPNLSEVQETVGRFYWARNMEEAGAAWKRAIELNPNNVTALSSYGYWHWVRRDSDEPFEYFRRALELDPFSLSRHADLGYFLGNEARIEETEQIIERIKAMFDTAQSYRLVADLLNLIGRTDESIAWTVRAMEREPDETLHVSALAEYLIDIGAVAIALKLEPDPSIGLLIKLRRYAEFIERAEFRMIDEPDDIYLRYLLAYAYNVTGRHSDAVRTLRNAGVGGDWESEPRQIIDIEAIVLLADATHASGEIELGRKIAESWLGRAHTTSPNWWIHLYSACAYAILDRDAEAIDEFELIRKSPRLPWTHLLRDSRCLLKFTGEPQYAEMLNHVKDRQRELRERLPDTLAAHGAQLPELFDQLAEK